MFYEHPDVEEPRTRSPEAALAPPRPSPHRGSPPGPRGPLEAPLGPWASPARWGATGPSMPSSSWRSPGPRRGGTRRRSTSPATRDIPGADSNWETSRHRLPGGDEFNPEQSPVIDSLAPRLPRGRSVRRPRGASRYVAPGPRPGGEHLGTGTPVRGRARAPPSATPGGCSGTPSHAGERVPRAPSDT
jgi:hypothetical protein